MSELLQYDGTRWVDYGPSTPTADPVSLRDAHDTWRQVSDLRPGHPDGLRMLTLAHRYPLGAVDDGKWLPGWDDVLLARRRMWTGARWMPGESHSEDTRHYAETGYSGSLVSVTQVLEAGPSEGGPALGAVGRHWDSGVGIHLFARIGPGDSWREFKIGANTNLPAYVIDGANILKARDAVAGDPDRYEWVVKIGYAVANMIKGKACTILVDGEGEYGPWAFGFTAATPWTKGVAPVHHTTAPHTVTASIKWDAAYDGKDHGYVRRSDHASNPWQDHLVVGRFDSTHGVTHSIMRFDLSHIPHGATVTSVKLRLYADHWFLNSGGSAKIRNVSSHRASPPGHHTPITSGHTTVFHWSTKTGYKTMDIGGGQGWANGTLNAIQVEHTTTSQAGYGVLAATGSRKPRLIIRYTA